MATRQMAEWKVIGFDNKGTDIGLDAVLALELRTLAMSKRTSPAVSLASPAHPKAMRRNACSDLPLDYVPPLATLPRPGSPHRPCARPRDLPTQGCCSVVLSPVAAASATSAEVSEVGESGVSEAGALVSLRSRLASFAAFLAFSRFRFSKL